MPVEKESYRDNLSRILEQFPGKEILNISEVSKFFGRDRGAVRRMVPFNDQGYISIAKLARWMS